MGTTEVSAAQNRSWGTIKQPALDPAVGRSLQTCLSSFGSAVGTADSFRGLKGGQEERQGVQRTFKQFVYESEGRERSATEGDEGHESGFRQMNGVGVLSSEKRWEKDFRPNEEEKVTEKPGRSEGSVTWSLREKALRTQRKTSFH